MRHEHPFYFYIRPFLLLNTDSFLYKPLCRQTLLHKDSATHRRWYPKLAHRNTSKQKYFYTKIVLHIDAIIVHTQTLLHTDVSTQKRFCTDTLLYRHVFPHAILFPDFLTLNHLLMLAGTKNVPSES